MRRFSDLYEALDSTSSTGAKVETMAQYFRAAQAEDAAWAVFFLTGQRSKRLISPLMSLSFLPRSRTPALPTARSPYNYFANRFQISTTLIAGGTAEFTRALKRKRSPLTLGEY